MSDLKELRDHGKACGHPSAYKNRGLWVCAQEDCPGGTSVFLKPSGSLARSWTCRNCGSDHGDDSCENPDFDSILFYTIEPVPS